MQQQYSKKHVKHRTSNLGLDTLGLQYSTCNGVLFMASVKVNVLLSASAVSVNCFIPVLLWA